MTFWPARGVLGQQADRAASENSEEEGLADEFHDFVLFSLKF